MGAIPSTDELMIADRDAVGATMRTTLLLFYMMLPMFLCASAHGDALSPEDKVVKTLADKASDFAVSFPQRLNAVDAIGRIGARSSKSVIQLKKLLGASVDESQEDLFRMHVVDALASMGPDATTAAPDLADIDTIDPVLLAHIQFAIAAITVAKPAAKAEPDPTKALKGAIQGYNDLVSNPDRVAAFNAAVEVMSDRKNKDTTSRRIAALAAAALLPKPPLTPNPTAPPAPAGGGGAAAASAVPNLDGYVEGLVQMLVTKEGGNYNAADQIFAARAIGSIPSLSCVPVELLKLQSDKDADPDVIAIAASVVKKLSGISAKTTTSKDTDVGTSTASTAGKSTPAGFANAKTLPPLPTPDLPLPAGN